MKPIKPIKPIKEEYAAIYGQGDDITVVTTVVDDNEQPTQLASGERLIAAFYNSFGRLICHADQTTMTYDVGDGCYCWGVTHRDTMNCVGVVFLETTLINANGVAHSPEKLKCYFKPYQNNKLV